MIRSRGECIRLSKEDGIILRIPKRKQMRFVSKMLTFGCIVLTAYTAVTMVLCWHAMTTPPDALTYALFGFWGVEGGWSALIRVSEKKQKEETDELERP